MKSKAFALLAMALMGMAGWAQHHHGAMQMATVPIRLDVQDRGADGLWLRLGPVELPAGNEMTMPQAVTFTVPFDGWITAYHPRMTNAGGEVLPGRLLHHVAFWNLGRKDFLCPAHDEHIFGAGGELNDWPKQPGVGYRVHRGDRIKITSMFHNPTAAAYPGALLEVRLEYQRADAGPELRSVYPAWFDVKGCGNSAYDLQAGPSAQTGQFTLLYSGTLLGVGGHLHDYGRQLVLSNVTRRAQIATLAANTDNDGRLLSMPVRTFAPAGYHLDKGDLLSVTARYDNTSGHELPEGAMGIVVGYFIPDQEAHFATLRTK